MPNDTLLIGLTGGIAVGKSTVADYLRRSGYPVIDADRLGHRVLEKGHAAYTPVIETFGQGVLDEQGNIDRKKLGAIVFQDPTARQQLNQITHPLIGELIESRLTELAEHSAPGAPIFLETALLIESRWLERCAQVWVVLAFETEIVARLQDRNGLEESQARARMNSQMRPEDRLPHAQVVLQNSGSLADLYRQVEAALNQLHTTKRS